MSWTKEQRAIYKKEYREKNKEQIAAYLKKWKGRNKEKMATYNKTYREKNVEYIAAYAKEYHEKNKEAIKEYREKNKEQIAIYKKEWNLKKYGLSLEDYNNMLDEQNHKCKLCLTSFTTLISKNIHIDHCHTTNKVRGVLCLHCNTGLGYFKDNTRTLTKAINYLQENG